MDQYIAKKLFIRDLTQKAKSNFLDFHLTQHPILKFHIRMVTQFYFVSITSDC